MACTDVRCQVVDDFSSRFDENPMQIVETIDASHRDMVRYRNEDEPGYRQIASALRKYTTTLALSHDAERICEPAIDDF